MDSFLREHLRCPLHRCLKLDAGDDGTMRCPECGAAFTFNDGIAGAFLGETRDREFSRNEEKQWDEHAAHYDRERENELVYMNCVYAGLNRIAPRVRDGEAVLDVGCGTGLGTERLHRSGMTTVAMDVSRRSLERLRAKVDRPGLVCLHACLPEIPLADGSCDHLICANTIQHLPDAATRRACVADFARVVKPGGTVVITVHNYSPAKKKAGWPKEGGAGSHSGPVRYIYRYELEEFRGLLAEFLVVEAMTGAGFHLPYKWKLSPLSVFLERRALQRLPSWADRGTMYVATCRAK